ncbi:MAG: glutathionylspermidine synthase family protein [Alphaproteobacteria bacterium]|nr:glutathionylspermidine synthase family protein [Alphaproteobacteria bacterium]
MKRIEIAERDDWRAQAEALGFNFHTMHGDPYWDETACYRFTLRQIEDDIEDPSAVIESMCFDVVSRAVEDSEVMAKLAIPESFWDYIRGSWLSADKNLYGRLDFSYDGNGPAKLLEYNADTPTSLYESSAFQWLWLEHALEREIIPPGCDQFNSIHEQMVQAFRNFEIEGRLHLASCEGSAEDEGTVRYIEECAVQAGLETTFLHMENIGIDTNGHFTDGEDMGIRNLFKLYPWEWMMADDFGKSVPQSGVTFIEPAWRAILSNKGLLPLLWEMFEGHPNLLPAYFADDPRATDLEGGYVRKPLLSREGANVEMFRPGVGPGDASLSVEGPYGAEGFVVQALHPLPVFDGNHTVIGSWLVASQPCGIGIREDNSPITKDSSRFLPHVIFD